MVDMENNYCDLCEKENCTGPMQLAHKPYVFHFYHANQYKEALEQYQSEQDVEENSSIDDESAREDESDPGEDDEGEEIDNVEEDKDVSEGEESDEEEKQPLLENTDDDYDRVSGDETPANEEEEDAEDTQDEQVEDSEDVTADEAPEEPEDKHIIPTPALQSVISDVNEIMCKTIDVTMAAGVGIMAGIVSMTSGMTSARPIVNEYSPASVLNMETMTKSCVGTALAAIGMAAGIKEILNAVNEKPPALPVCEYCNKCELQQPGCKVFCEACGECKDRSYWKDGAEDMHCLRICNDCNTHCVLCEENIATVKGHHKAFTTNVHGKLSTRLDGTYKDARVFGSSLIIAGILTCVVPGISWSWGVGLVAGSVIANSGIRIVASPVVKIRCHNCDLEEDAGKFEKSVGCQTWCQCCGVQEGTEEDKYCMALCEDCSQE